LGESGKAMALQDLNEYSKFEMDRLNLVHKSYHRKLFARGKWKTRRYELKDTLYCSARDMRWTARPLRPVVGAHDTAHGSP
jgi:hypothetical protein